MGVFSYSYKPSFEFKFRGDIFKKIQNKIFDETLPELVSILSNN